MICLKSSLLHEEGHISNSFDGEEYVVLLVQGLGAEIESPTKIRLLKFTPELNLETWM